MSAFPQPTFYCERSGEGVGIGVFRADLKVDPVGPFRPVLSSNEDARA